MVKASKMIAAPQAEQRAEAPETRDETKPGDRNMNRGYWGYREANEEDEDGGLSTCGGSCGG